MFHANKRGETQMNDLCFSGNALIKILFEGVEYLSR